ncbi:MAG: hypothetical protein DI556_18515 [Rhodovulum sulfidophilum]|uniref:TfuA-like core domain-containing protein n=1 Tax=Rhodovulum sulfidophilum TaxID=35806 RepID=A0A2W5N8E9_RHOSU|nr:MAG: hypothetical protein DI556_18515 [Rhodovulum sulfidophilum]
MARGGPTRAASRAGRGVVAVSAVLFAGPSLGGAIALPPGIASRPPAVAGDLYAAARDGATVIGLVDGAFEDRPTVWHKEILWALDRGVRVFGAASLGALRAVECAPFGMEGVGEIFARFRDGRLSDDAELALAFGPAELGYPALSEPLVNVRATLEAAVATRSLSRREAGALLDRASGLFFKELTWPRLLAEAAGLGWRPGRAERFATWLDGNRVDLKRADALLLVEAVGRALAEPRPARPAFRFAETRYWRAAVGWFDAREAAVSETEALVLDEMRLRPARFEAALIRAFARRATREDEGAAADGAAAVEELRLALDLGTAEEFRAWLAAVEGDPEALARALADEERLRRAIEAALPTLVPSVLDEARVDGRFEKLADRGRAKRALLGPAAPRYDEAELRTLLEALCARQGISAEVEDLDLLAGSLGLADRRALHRLLRREEDFTAGPKERSA